MQRPPPPRRRSRIPTRQRGSLGDLRASGAPPGAQGASMAALSHDSGISRSVSLASLASTAPNRAGPATVPQRKQAPAGRNSPRKLLDEPLDPHQHCKIALDLYKSENEALKRELTKTKMEMDTLRMEFGAHSRRVVLPSAPAEDPLLNIQPLKLHFIRSHSCEGLLERDASEDESEINDYDQSLIEFWTKRNEEPVQATAVPEGKRASSVPSEVWTLENKSESMISSRRTSTPISGPCLQDLPTEDSLSKVQRWTAKQTNGGEEGRMAPPPLQWQPCRNPKARPTKLDLARADASQGQMVKRLESRAAISLLSPRPFSAAPTFVPPLDLSKIRHGNSSYSQDSQNQPLLTMPANTSHKFLVNAQSSAAQSRAILRRLQERK
ncbi:uncharacterized protein LOC132195721 [Neocloeon triangulifer]|uniref:uncharacterized protein LOC132195721 n=1 Tax=Neocloeon triangulifer TaxID=2078957 RepID=UPI00286F61D8|nr:uncharacterized protein LOC132195721 [Neocloeon triangulifer]